MSNTRFLRSALYALGILSAARSAHAATFTVNTSGDTADAAAGNGLCDDGTGKCSLRAAVMEANAFAGADRIEFNIPGAGPHTITMGARTRFIDPRTPMVIDARTQPGYVDKPLVFLDASATTDSRAVSVYSGDIELYALGIYGTANGTTDKTGMAVEFYPPTATDVLNKNVIEGCWLGLDATGVPRNTSRGLAVGGPGKVTNLVVRNNVIAGGGGVTNGYAYGVAFYQVYGATIVGNRIGLGASGATVAGANAANGFNLNNSEDIDLGDGTAAGRNYISGWNGSALSSSLSKNLDIKGNYFGTDIAGAAAVPNLSPSSAVALSSLTNLTFDGNVVSGNTSGYGIMVSGATVQTGLKFTNNMLGVSADGSVALGNKNAGLYLGGANTATEIVGNVISDSKNYIGLEIGCGGDVKVLGNKIGTNAAGTVALGNKLSGIHVYKNGPCAAAPSGAQIGDGTLAGRNVIAGNGKAAVTLQGTSGAQIVGNYLGTDVTGNVALANGTGGPSDNDLIYFSGSNVATKITGNILGGSSHHGIAFASPTLTETGIEILGNSIGIGADGFSVIRNANSGIAGYAVFGKFGGLLPGEANRISNNLVGVQLLPTTTQGMASFRGNQVWGNTQLGFGLTSAASSPLLNDPSDSDVGPNDLLNFPVPYSITKNAGGDLVIKGWLRNAATTEVDVYANTARDASGFGEGEVYVGTYKSGTAGFSVTASGTEAYSFGPLGADSNVDAFEIVVPAATLATLPAGASFFSTTANAMSGTNMVTSEFSYIVEQDTDGDGLVDSEEGRGASQDTDGDGVLDYLDTDDDGDGLLTKDESGRTSPADLLSAKALIDSDGDGKADVVDVDDDNDGVSTKDEVLASALPAVVAANTAAFPTKPNDLDGDGLLNWLDKDADGDGKEDLADGTNDIDADTKPNFLDGDSWNQDTDGDGVSDFDECRGNLGTCASVDTDTDGTPDFQDTDDDGDGLPTSLELTKGDTDGDGTKDYLDADDDGDLVLTKDEVGPLYAASTDGGAGGVLLDTDADGTPDVYDLDDDGDTVPTKDEVTAGKLAAVNSEDVDGDGKKNWLDTDADGDSYLDGADGTEDNDSDTKPNFLDADTWNADTDKDGVPDSTECKLANGTVNCAGIDTDKDGTPDFQDTDDDGDGVLTSDELAQGDSDKDGTKDYIDADDDGDGIDTKTERKDAADAGKSDDIDGDGKKNWLDDDADGDGVKDGSEKTDADNNGTPDYLEKPGSTPTTPVQTAQSGGGVAGGGINCSAAPSTGTSLGLLAGAAALLAAATRRKKRAA